MISLPASLLALSQKVRGSDPWLWLYEITVDSTTIARTLLRFVHHPSPITFGSETYYPFPITHTDLEENDQKNLPSFDIQLSHVTRELARYLETGRGLRGAAVRMNLTSAAAAPAGDTVREYGAVVQEITAKADAILLRCGTDVLTNREFPPEQLTRTRCPFRYGGPQCGIRLTTAMLAIYPTCPKTYAACIERGIQEAAEGWPNMHPRRFGAYPAIPRSVRR